MRIWSGRPYGSPTIEFARAVVVAVDSIQLEPGALVVSPISFPESRKRLRIRKNETTPDRVARLDGFKNWNELVAALESHHGAPLAFDGFRYTFAGFVFLTNSDFERLRGVE